MPKKLKRKKIKGHEAVSYLGERMAELMEDEE